jgi:hypothetical protein
MRYALQFNYGMRYALHLSIDFKLIYLANYDQKSTFIAKGILYLKMVFLISCPTDINVSEIE